MAHGADAVGQTDLPAPSGSAGCLLTLRLSGERQKRDKRQRRAKSFLVIGTCCTPRAWL